MKTISSFREFAIPREQAKKIKGGAIECTVIAYVEGDRIQSTGPCSGSSTAECAAYGAANNCSSWLSQGATSCSVQCYQE